MTFLEKYFIDWYTKLAYAGNFTYCCFLLIWIFGIASELKITLKRRKRLESLVPYDESNIIWKEHYKNNMFKQIFMLTIVLLEMVIVVLSQMDLLYIPIYYPLYYNESAILLNKTEGTIFHCIATNSFVSLGVGIFSVEMTVYLYILWTYGMCLNYCSMAYFNRIELRKLCKPTLSGAVMSTLSLILTFSKYTLPVAVCNYAVQIILATVYVVSSQKQIIRTMRRKRFDVNQSKSKSQVRRIDRELKYVKTIGGCILIIGTIRIVSNFSSGSIGNVIIPIVRNPCWVRFNFHKTISQVNKITETIAQVVYTIGKLVNMSYVLIILALNAFVACAYFRDKKAKLSRIVTKKYTNYGKPLRRNLL